MNSKQYVDGSKWSERKKQANANHFKCERRDVARELNYFKHTYPSKMTTVQAEKPRGYNYSFISTLGYSGSILDPYISQVFHVKMQALIIYHLIYKRLEGGLLRPSLI